MENNQEWSSLAADWQGQDTPAIDIEAIRDEAERRSQGLRRVIRVEVAFALLVIVVCVWIAASPRSDRVETLLFSGMALFLVVYQGLMVWIRRRDLADAGGDALSLVEREIQRAHTVLRYWRWGMWSALALWLAIYGVMLFGMASDWPLRRISGLWGGAAVNVLVFPAMGAYGWWRCSQARARLRRFGALREQLRAP
ncbi:MAG: hypothetical protein K0M70_01000 [Arenimonas sp.]|uniref:hypothetical protein n=1 Tax=Arenimonas sp. TaxID=1872635 RepID=UPI0025B80397|nr:hypothetical protein [Arenimonas sp.]MBW8366425.1 hypothetical protein [Arenimonas sp.]